jgi:hypothetical protein
MQKDVRSQLPHWILVVVVVVLASLALSIYISQSLRAHVDMINEYFTFHP